MKASQAVSQLRARFGLTMDALVEKSGVAKTSINRAEKGANISLDTLEKLAAATHTELSVTFEDVAPELDMASVHVTSEIKQSRGGKRMYKTFDFDLPALLDPSLASDVGLGSAPMPASYYSALAVAKIAKAEGFEEDFLARQGMYMMLGRPGALEMVVEKMLVDYFQSEEREDALDDGESGDFELQTGGHGMTVVYAKQAGMVVTAVKTWEGLE